MRYQQKPITRSVFRAYDIRGIIGQDLDEDAYYTLGLAIACYLETVDRRCIYLARDGRLTSEALALALKTGLLDSGIDVIDLGAVATPVMYFATHTQGVDCGLMVTGSHNPSQYNGIKMVLAGTTLTQKHIDILYEYVHQQKRRRGQGTERALDILPAYTARLIRDLRLQRPMKVVVDCGNGIAGPVVPEVLRHLGCTVIPLYCDVDGRFPNHHPDPTVESNLLDLKQAVAEHQADIGLAFDGDADRLGLVTNLGEMIYPDRLMMLFAQNVLARMPHAPIVFDVKCSAHLEHIITAAGGIPIMCPTGHSIVKAVMKEQHAALAGEMSGHIFFKEGWYGFDDALYSACRLLEIMSASELSVSQQFAHIPNSVNTPEIKISIPDDAKFLFMERFCREAHFTDARVIRLDGLRVEFSQGWGLLRASNTTPCLIARFEAEDEEHLLWIKQQFKAQMHALDAALNVPF